MVIMQTQLTELLYFLSQGPLTIRFSHLLFIYMPSTGRCEVRSYISIAEARQNKKIKKNTQEMYIFKYYQLRQIV